jgi:hypothetical protein
VPFWKRGRPKDPNAKLQLACASQLPAPGNSQFSFIFLNMYSAGSCLFPISDAPIFAAFFVTKAFDSFDLDGAKRNR